MIEPGVRLIGNVQLGEGVSIAAPCEVNARYSSVLIGSGCDIASFVVINVADSHLRCLGLRDEIERAPIVLGSNVFVGSHCFIGGGFTIGHHSVLAAGTMLTGDGAAGNQGTRVIPPYTLVLGNLWRMIPGYYAKKERHDRA